MSTSKGAKGSVPIDTVGGDWMVWGGIPGTLSRIQSQLHELLPFACHGLRRAGVDIANQISYHICAG